LIFFNCCSCITITEAMYMNDVGVFLV
jgi:hypothetical protein